MAVQLVRPMLGVLAIPLWLSVRAGPLSAQATRGMVQMAKDVYTMTGAAATPALW